MARPNTQAAIFATLLCTGIVGFLSTGISLLLGLETRTVLGFSCTGIGLGLAWTVYGLTRE